MSIDAGFGSYTLNSNFESTYTFVETVEINSFTAFPNPYLNYLKRKCVVGIKQLSVHNILGEQLLFEELFGKKSYSLPTSDLKNGIYILSIEDINGNRKALRVIKQ